MKILVLTNEYQAYSKEHKYDYRILPGGGYINYAGILNQLDLSQYDAVFMNTPTKISSLLLTNGVLEWKQEVSQPNEKIYIHNKNNLLFNCLKYFFSNIFRRLLLLSIAITLDPSFKNSSNKFKPSPLAAPTIRILLFFRLICIL